MDGNHDKPSQDKQQQESVHDKEVSQAQVNVITHSNLPHSGHTSSTSYLTQGAQEGFQNEMQVEDTILESIANSLMKTPNFRTFVGKLGFDNEAAREAARIRLPLK